MKKSPRSFLSMIKKWNRHLFNSQYSQTLKPFAPLPPCRPPNPWLTPIPGNNEYRSTLGGSKRGRGFKKSISENIEDNIALMLFLKKAQLIERLCCLNMAHKDD
jgi:hypothetical protein